MKQPYRFWTREELYKHLLRQGRHYEYDNLYELRQMVYDSRWNPIEEYNGCNVVQDELHPFLPCFVHDYRWVVQGGGNKTDLEFRNNLRIFTFSRVKSNLYYLMVRLGWLFYYKWVKKVKNN